jgi:dihydroorotase
VLHLTTALEMPLFSMSRRNEKNITAEVCVHHLWFDESRYEELGTRIKCNPAIKTAEDREALVAAVNDGRIDIIATDHAPHTAAEKRQGYFEAPAGLPLVQHAVQILFDLAGDGRIGLETVVDRTSHAVADIFGVVDRGYVREGYFADLVLVDPDKPYTVEPANLLYKCGWSPFEGHRFSSSIDTTIVNGRIVFRDGNPTGDSVGQRLQFNRGR